MANRYAISNPARGQGLGEAFPIVFSLLNFSTLFLLIDKFLNDNQVVLCGRFCPSVQNALDVNLSHYDKCLSNTSTCTDSPLLLNFLDS